MEGQARMKRLSSGPKVGVKRKDQRMREQKEQQRPTHWTTRRDENSPYSQFPSIPRNPRGFAIFLLAVFSIISRWRSACIL
jgi:hypothetical protein